jgi:hypothetical protein
LYVGAFHFTLTSPQDPRGELSLKVKRKGGEASFSDS